MVTAATPIRTEDLRRLHPRAIDDPRAIRDLLERLRREDRRLTRSTNRRNEPETARVVEVGADDLLLETRHFEAQSRNQVFLNFELDGRPYFFAAPRRADPGGDLLRLELPAVVYQAERRDRARRPARAGRVALLDASRRLGVGEVLDASPGGLGVRVPASLALPSDVSLAIHFLEGERAGDRAFARVRNAAGPGADGIPGWRRIGLSLSAHPAGPPLAVESRQSILGEALARAHPTGRADRVVSTPVARHRDALCVVDYRNAQDEPVRALLDGWGPSRGAPAVIIPPAWGRTKETLLPLAATIVATFRQAGEPVSVLRYDGVRKRGESHRDPECRAPGAEYLRFTFSQGVRDAHAALDYLERTPELAPRTSVLVTFSVASIEGRRAVASEARGRLGGWVSVVGSADAQSLTRVISGGVDFFGGAERGMRFGHQELQGLLVDMDLAGRDAIEHGMAFLEDARRDFARIDVPVTWIHGRDDAWMDLARVREVMAFGDTSRRRLIQVPTGHQLRTSREALETFQLIAVEIARMVLGRELPPALPDLAWLEQRRASERARLTRPEVDLRGFWRDYLVGRDGEVGMELVTSTRPYRELMDLQVDALALRTGERVLDLGSGVGSFPVHLAESGTLPPDVRVVEADYVHEALCRGRTRLRDTPCGPRVHFLACDLDLVRGRASVPCAGERFDAVLASLLLNYVREPAVLLREMHRVLRPGGRLVLSSLKRDADTSTICVDTVSELRTGRGREVFGRSGERRMGRALQHFINDAARLLDFEEQGHFHFWDADELVDQLAQAGFVDARAVSAFGRAPQAFVVTARRPE